MVIVGAVPHERGFNQQELQNYPPSTSSGVRVETGRFASSSSSSSTAPQYPTNYNANPYSTSTRNTPSYRQNQSSPSLTKRIKNFLQLHCRDFKAPFKVLIEKTCWCYPSNQLKKKRSLYHQLVELEENEEDCTTASPVLLETQYLVDKVGDFFIYLAMALMGFFLVKVILQDNDNNANKTGVKIKDDPGIEKHPFEVFDFERDAPILILVTICEILFCGASCKAAASMFRTREHALKHPRTKLIAANAISRSSASADVRGATAPAVVTIGTTTSATTRGQPAAGNGIASNTSTTQLPSATDVIPIFLERANLAEKWGILYRPSSDGLECLLVDGVVDYQYDLGPSSTSSSTSGQPTAFLSQAATTSQLTPAAVWNQKFNAYLAADSARFGVLQFGPRNREIDFSLDHDLAILAVNDCHADVFSMQKELLTSFSVALYCRRINKDTIHEMDSGNNRTGSTSTNDVLRPPVGASSDDISSRRDVDQQMGASHFRNPSSVMVLMDHRVTTTNGETNENGDEGNGTSTISNTTMQRISETRTDQEQQQSTLSRTFSITSFEDEDLVTLSRWIICGMIFGWITLIPTLLIKPHFFKRRQQLFREVFLNAGGAASSGFNLFVNNWKNFILPLWLFLWVVDGIEIMAHVRLLGPPFVYFLSTHVVLASVVVVLGMRLQQKDEELVLEQRRIRDGEFLLGRISHAGQEDVGVAVAVEETTSSSSSAAGDADGDPGGKKESEVSTTITILTRDGIIFYDPRKNFRRIKDPNQLLRGIAENHPEIVNYNSAETTIAGAPANQENQLTQGSSTFKASFVPKKIELERKTIGGDQHLGQDDPEARIMYRDLQTDILFADDVDGTLESLLEDGGTSRQRQTKAKLGTSSSNANDHQTSSSPSTGVLGSTTASQTTKICEEPAPILLRELLISNPFGIVWIGLFLSLTIILSQLLYPLQTKRGKLAQSYLLTMYSSLLSLQLFGLIVILNMKFENLPTTYLHAFLLLFSYPCLCSYCVCLCCSANYSRADMLLVLDQRKAGLMTGRFDSVGEGFGSSSGGVVEDGGSAATTAANGSRVVATRNASANTNELNVDKHLEAILAEESNSREGMLSYYV
ncbi:unnamed protein product [Amoebophrya sp. A120]|nr:unnamed protein product [Amoebophrya sp. A120]|eukprot:GSA120T00023915001.1